MGGNRRKPKLQRIPSHPLLRLASLALRLGGTLTVVGICLWFLGTRLQGFDAAEVWAEIGRLYPWQWAGGIAAVAVAFLAVARQERVILRHLGLHVDGVHLAATAMATAGVSQAVGFGPVVGALLRARMLKQITLRQSFLVSAATTIGFFSGAGLLTLGLMAANGSVLAGVATVAILGLVALRGLRSEVGWRSLRLPSAVSSLALLFWVALDLMALGSAFWVLLPPGHGIDWVEAATAFVLSLTFALMSGSPAGTGPFEALVLVQLPDLPPETLIAGLIAFRGTAYLLPAVLGAVWSLLAPLVLPRARPCPVDFVGPEAAFTAPDRAEVLLARQGDLKLARDDLGQVWTTTHLGGHRLMIGEPACPADRSPVRCLGPFFDLCAYEGIPPLFYKIGPRQALAAREAGMAVWRIAQEAVIDPQRHTTEGPAHAGLRRKLRHAVKSGVVLRDGGSLPLDEMARLSADWAKRHGGERGLTTGRWGAEYVAGQRVLRAEDASGRLLAFVTFHVTQKDWVLDLIRFAKDVPDGTLYLLIQSAIEAARQDGAERLSLAAIPCEGFSARGWRGRVLQRLTRGSRGLHQFKATFAPRWESRYAAAPSWIGLCLGLALVALALRIPRPERRIATPESRSHSLQTDAAQGLAATGGKVARFLRPRQLPKPSNTTEAPRKRRFGR